MTVRYDAIFEWNMSSIEASAFKLAIVYETEFLKTFPDADRDTYQRNTISKRTDPRKSNLFRYCWKLRRETRGLLEPEEFPLYIRANLAILKMNQAKGQKAGKIYIAPNALCGDKAWIRWKVYQRWYKNKLCDKNATPPPPSVSASDPKVISEIDRTKKFLFEKCEGEVTKEKLQKFAEGGQFRFWIMTGKISKYYIVLSPFMKEYKKALSEACEFDLVLIGNRATDAVKEYFRYEYGHEYGTDSVEV